MAEKPEAHGEGPERRDEDADGGMLGEGAFVRAAARLLPEGTDLLPAVSRML